MKRDATDLFLELVPERVLAAVEAAGLRCNPVCYPLNSFENRVYEVELADRSRVVAKFYRPQRWSEEQILEEHRFLAELYQEEVPVCPMRPFPGGATLHTIDDIFYCVADRRGGRAPDELDPARARRLGMLVARVHNVGARRAAAPRLRLDAEAMIREPLRFLERSGALPGAVAQRYRTTALEIAEWADRRLADLVVIRLHGDLHLGNVLERDRELRLLDFDDMTNGPAVQDVWLALPGRDRFAEGLREAFLDGYRMFRDFDPRELHAAEVLRGMRMVHYAGWLARRYHDPAFRLAWPLFGTGDYWQREADDLAAQLRVVRGEADADEQARTRPLETARASEEDTSLLSNKDYFFDWEGD